MTEDVGPVFRLLQLPPEVRNIVYSHVFYCRIHPYSYMTGAAVPPFKYINNSRITEDISNFRRTCKQIRLETRDAIFRYSAIIVPDPCRLHQWLAELQPFQRDAIRSVEVHWDGRTGQGYSRFNRNRWGCSPHDPMPVWFNATDMALKAHLPLLQHVHFDLQYRNVACSCTWGQYLELIMDNVKVHEMQLQEWNAGCGTSVGVQVGSGTYQ